MKSLKLSLFICIATTAIALISCKTDPCLNKVCKNLGVAKETPDGKSCTCECSVGYTGDSCQTTVLSTLTSKAWSATRTVNGVPKTTPYSVMFTQNLTSLTSIKLNFSSTFNNC